MSHPMLNQTWPFSWREEDEVSHPMLRLSYDEEKLWKDLQRLQVRYPSRRGRVTRFFWKNAVEAFRKGDFICSSILAGITAELAHKTKLCEQDVIMKKSNGTPKSWRELIEDHEKNEEIKGIARKIKNDYRNVWVHPDLEEIEEYLKREGGPLTTDAELNIAFASANALKVLELTAQLLKMLGYTENAKSNGVLA